MIDWRSLLDSHSIEYVERGPHTSHGNLQINCPFCPNDQTHHMGISLRDGFFNCWDNENHRGRSPVRLIQALLQCSRLQAESLANSQVILPLDNFAAVIASLSQETIKTEDKVEHVVFPPNIRTIVDKGMGRRFIDYLVTRDYTREEAKHLCEVYWLMYAITGPFAYRIIIPIEMEDGIVTWTGRDITGTSETRYKTLSKEESRCSIKEALFGYKSLIEDNTAHTLIVCEGPFDALRVDFFGYPFGIRGTCLFGLQASDTQISLLTTLSDKFKYKYICLDAGAIVLQLHLLRKLEFLGFKGLTLPQSYKDPGELPKPILNEWFQKISVS